MNYLFNGEGFLGLQTVGNNFPSLMTGPTCLSGPSNNLISPFKMFSGCKLLRLLITIFLNVGRVNLLLRGGVGSLKLTKNLISGFCHVVKKLTDQVRRERERATPNRVYFVHNNSPYAHQLICRSC